MWRMHIWIKPIFVFFVVCASGFAKASTLVIQYTDAHSTLNTLPRQVLAIDHHAQEYLRKQPGGEVVVLAVGDLSSINAYNRLDGGWLELESLVQLARRGYRVVFVVGNHDAFSWGVRIDGMELFVEQMRYLHRGGVTVLASNLSGVAADLKPYISPSFVLNGLDKRTHVLGLTLPDLIGRSSLIERNMGRLFEGVESLEETLARELPRLEAEGVERVFLAIHQGHQENQSQARGIDRIIQQRGLKLDVPIIWGAHDHVLVDYESDGRRFMNSGAYGSFNVVELSSAGQVLSPVRHITPSLNAYALGVPSLFQGVAIEMNTVRVEDVMTSWLRPYAHRVWGQYEKAERALGRTIAETSGFQTTRSDMRKSRQDLGSILAEALVEWATDRLGGQARHKTVALVNSSSYGMDWVIPAGPLTEADVRNFYKYLNNAVVYEMSGHQVESVYFALRRKFSQVSASGYSPQMNFGVREMGAHLEIKTGLDWQRLSPHEVYYVALDGWLAQHKENEGYRIQELLNVVLDVRPLLSESFQDILVRYIAGPIRAYEQGRRGPLERSRQCRQLFSI